jgi:hypothetical protein
MEKRLKTQEQVLFFTFNTDQSPLIPQKMLTGNYAYTLKFKFRKESESNTGLHVKSNLSM